MTTIDFKGANVNIAEKQKEYITLPAYAGKDEVGTSIAFCCKLTKEEIDQVNKRGEVWIKLYTFGRAMQPISSSLLLQDCLPQTIASELLK